MNLEESVLTELLATESTRSDQAQVYPGALNLRRNPTIDFLKGMLILFVLAGHLFVVPVVESPWKWLIYGFHMPLFLGVSGYLFRAPKHFDLRSFFERYGKRLILPWVVAFLVYTLAFVRLANATSLLKAILHPWYHLWFVPVLVAYFCLASCKLSISKLVAISAAVTVASSLFFGWLSYPGYQHELPALFQKVLLLTGDSRLYTLSVFFFWGLFVHSAGPFLKRPAVASLFAIGLVCGLVLWIDAYQSPSFLLVCGTFTLLNLCAIGCLPFVFSGPQVRNAVVEHLGQQSLFYYLWHPMLFSAFKRFVYPRLDWPAASFLTFGASLFLLFCVLAGLRRINARRLEMLLGISSPVSRT